MGHVDRTCRSAIDRLAEISRNLAKLRRKEILRWAVETYHPKLTMATAFGPEGCVILHMLAEIEPKVRVFNLDTGYQFAETLKLRTRSPSGTGSSRTGPTLGVGRGVRGQEPRPALPSPIPTSAAVNGSWSRSIGSGRLRRLDLGDSRGSVEPSSAGSGRWLGRQVQSGENQPPAPLDQT